MELTKITKSKHLGRDILSDVGSTLLTLLMQETKNCGVRTENDIETEMSVPKSRNPVNIIIPLETVVTVPLTGVGLKRKLEGITGVVTSGKRVFLASTRRARISSTPS